MSQQIFLKRSSVPGKQPTTAQLGLGELAINTHDGKVYLKKNDGTESIVEVGSVSSVAGKTGAVVLNIGDVTGLQAALDTKLETETVTSLTAVGNELRYTNEAGVTQTVDLSLYLDDTNLARIVSGTYDAPSQSLIFTRDDGSTFSVDASMFFDDTNLVTSVAGKTGAVTLVIADVSGLQTALDSKVDKVAGKGLSTEDYTTAEKTKLAGIEAGAQVNTVTSVAGRTGAVTLSASDVSGLAAVATSGSYNDLTDKPVIDEFSLPVATTTVLGGVKDGAGVTIAADGTISADVTSVAGRTGAVVLTKSDVGLANVDNTADSTKSVASAAKLTTARTINGVSFDGTANITVADSTKLPLAGGTMTGAITFAAGQTWPTFNQNTTGSAATLTTGRTIGMTGDVTWTSGSFNGSANVTGTATLANSGVTAGTYPKVTVDAKGRVTAGASLAAADIPNLDASKITSGTIDAARLPAMSASSVSTANWTFGQDTDGSLVFKYNGVAKARLGTDGTFLAINVDSDPTP